MADDTLRCPKCNSSQLSVDKKGFGLGKAATGGLLLGPVGLLGGLIGSKKIQITCLKCGHTWKAGQA
jgi:tellurium resistance protein TerD